MLDLKNIVKQIQILNDYKISEEAGLNLLHAVLTHVFAFKNVRFESINNLDSLDYLAYYAFNFVGSGGCKNKALKDIRNKVVPFFKTELDNFNEYRKNKLELKYIKELQSLTDGSTEFKMKTKEQDEALKNFRKLEYVLSNATQSSIYQSLEIIKESNKGSVFIEDTEFMDSFEEANFEHDATRKQFLKCINNFYDGEYLPTNTTSIQREPINGFSTSIVLMSDPESMLDEEKICRKFKKHLKSGWARRSFIYYKKDENFNGDNIYYPTVEEKEDAIAKLKEYAKEINKIYTDVTDLMFYKFTPSANNAVTEWKKAVSYKVNNLYKYTKRLNKDSKILEINLQGSPWKIIKLAVLYHILEQPTKRDVQPESFKKACEFFEIMHENLEYLLLDKTTSDYDDMYSYFLSNLNKFISKKELREQKFVDKREFKDWIKEAIPEMTNLCASTGLQFVYTMTGQNTGISYALYDPKKFDYNIIKNDGKGNIVATLTDKSKTGLIETDTLD